MAEQLEKSNSTVHNITDLPRIDVAIQTLSKRSMFWRPVYLAQSAWLEHIPFAFWLTEAHRPSLFVELGVHYGVSYFAFCQAVERLGLDTRCFAIDTFKGDEHAGTYGGDVFEQVYAHNDRQYSGFSRIVRSTFDDALKHFSDGSVDLLHIDGLHTIEAVRHDFESWLPKLSKRAIVVMHDTNVRERNFGVFKLFESLKKKYPHFEFVHGHGLGVLGVGEEQNDLMKLLFNASNSDHSRQSVHEVFSRLGQACSSALTSSVQKERAKLLQGSIEKQKKQLDEVSQSLEKKNAEIDSLSKELTLAKDAFQTQLQQHVIEKENFVERANLLRELRSELKDDVVRLQRQLEAATSELTLKNQELAILDRERNEYKQKIDFVTTQLTERDCSIADLNEKISSKIASEQEQTDVVKKLSADKAHFAEQLAERDLVIADLHEKIAQLTSNNEHLSREMQILNENKNKQTKYLEEKTKNLTSIIKVLKQKDAALREKSKAVKEQEQRLEDRSKEISTLTKMVEERDHSLKTKDEEITEQKERVIKLDTDLKEKIESIKACEIQLSNTKEQAAAAQAKKDAIIVELQAELQKLKIEQHEQEKRLENRFIEAQSEILDAHSKEISDLKKIIESKTAEKQVMQDQIAQLTSKNDQLAREMQVLNTDKNKQTKDFEEKAKNLTAAIKMLEERSKEISTLTKMIEERDHSLKTKNKEITEQQQRAIKLDSDLKEKIESIKSYEKQLSNTKEQATAAQTKKDALVTELQAELQKLKKEQHEQEKRLENRFIEAQSEILDAHSKEVADLKKIIESTTAEKQVMQDQIAQLKLANEGQTKRLDDRFKELAALTALLEERDRALKAKDDELRAEKLASLPLLLEERDRQLLETDGEHKTEKHGISYRTNSLMSRHSSLEKSLAGEQNNSEKKTLSVTSQISLIERSGLFDKSWYLNQYPDVAESKMTPIQHYVLYGASEGRMPGPNFDTNRYIANYPELLSARINPLVHYITNEMNEGRTAMKDLNRIAGH